MIDQSVLHATLDALGDTRAHAAELYDRIKAAEAEHLAAAKAASAELRAQFATAKEEQEGLEALGRTLWAELQAERQEALRAGSLEIPISPPAGCTVAILRRPQILDPDALPREVCAPDPKRLRKALVSGPVPGAILAEVPSFRFPAAEEPCPSPSQPSQSALPPSAQCVKSPV